VRLIAHEDGRPPAAFPLAEQQHVRLERRPRLDRTRFGDHHAAIHLLQLHAAQEDADILARPALIQDLTEALDARHHARHRILGQTDQLDGISRTDDPRLDPACRHRATALDGMDVLHLEEEGLLDIPGGTGI